MIVQRFAGCVAEGRLSVGIGTAEVQREELPAIRAVTAGARRAMAARAVGEHDVIAGGERLHVRADGFDHAGAFMTEHGRQRHRIVLVAHDQVGVAQACRDDAHQHLSPRGARIRAGSIEKGAPAARATAAVTARVSFSVYMVGFLVKSDTAALRP